MKFRLLLRILLLSITLLFITLVSLLHLHKISRAQGGGIALLKVLNKPPSAGSTVQVGEFISFTIYLTNEASFSITNINLVDLYNEGGANNVLNFASASPPADLVNPATGLISWTNVASPPLLPGGTLSFTLFFTVEHPHDGAVVNRVEARDVTGGGSSGGFEADEDQADEAIGGSAPLFKSLYPPDSIPQVGLPVTFTQHITNQGLALITLLPLSDTYDPNVLQFNYAIPTPTITSSGNLFWADLTDYFGDIPGMGSVVVTTVFTALTSITNTTNKASTAGVQDEYQNDLAKGEADVPIFVIDVTPTPTETPTPTPTSEVIDDDDDDDDDDQPTPTLPAPTLAAPTVTPVVAVSTVTPSAIALAPESEAPRVLPETGYRSPNHYLLFSAIISLGLVIGYFALKRLKQ